MKKLIIIFIILFVLYGCQKEKAISFKDFFIVKDTVYTGEYGSEFNNEKLEFDLLRNGLNISYEKIDTSELKEFTYIVLVDDKEIPINIKIEDTNKPIIEGKTEFNIYKDEALDLNDHISAYDIVDGDLKLSFSDFDNSKVGTYEVIAKAVDKHNLETTLDITINVKEKEVISVPNITPPTSNSDILYIDGHIIVNKKYGLPASYAPGENPIALAQLRKLIADMRSEGLRISDSYSGYRSYQRQVTLYNNYARNYGQKEADRFSARPGFSEHQTGLTFDLKAPDGTLLTIDPEVTWVRNNAHKYGFVVRYPQGKEHITGYMYEPWHLRYFGSDATKIYNSNLTVEEYFNISSY